MKLVHLTHFNTIDLHDTGNGRFCLATVKQTLTAKVKLFELPDGVLYNPYGGGVAPIYPQKFTAEFLFRGSSPTAVETMYTEVTNQLGLTATLWGMDAGDTAVTVQAILEKIVRTDKWDKLSSRTIKFQATFQPLSNDWS